MIGAVVGVDEALLLVGLTLVTVALWPIVGRVALLAPGLALVWIGLPSRTSFVSRKDS